MCFVDNKQIAEFDIAKSILERRSSYQGSEHNPLTLVEFVNIIVEKASVDCLTLYQAVNLCKERPIIFPPGTKNKDVATCFISYLLAHKEDLLPYALTQIGATRFASNLDDPLKKYTASTTKDVVSDLVDPGSQWARFLRDTTEFDRFYSIKEGYLHLHKVQKLCPTFAVVSPHLALNRLGRLRKRFNKGHQVFVRDESTKAIDVLLCARLVASAKHRNLGYTMNIMRPEDDDLPHSLFLVPKRWKILANDELKKGQNQGTRQFLPFCRCLHTVGRLGEIHDGTDASGFFRYLQNFDWSDLNACVYDPQSTKECDLAKEELPENLKVARKNRLPRDRLFVGFKHKCLAKDCQKRFRNNVDLKEHLKTDHGVNDDDMEDIRNADAHATANFYRFRNEKEWIAEHSELTTEQGCRRCSNLLELTDEIINIHQQNAYYSNHLQREVESLLPRSNAPTYLSRAVDELTRTREDGLRMMIGQEDFARYFGIWVLVLNERAAVNRRVGEFVNRQKDELLKSKLMQTYRSAADDYRDSVRDAGGRDFTHLSDEGLIFRKRKASPDDAEDGYRLSLLATKLVKQQQQPPDVRTAVQTTREKAERRFNSPSCTEFSCDGNDDEEDEGNQDEGDDSLLDDGMDFTPGSQLTSPCLESKQQFSRTGTLTLPRHDAGKRSAAAATASSPQDIKNRGPIPIYELVKQDNHSRRLLTLFKPEKIKVNQFDVADKIRRIICRIYSKRIFAEDGLQEIVADIVRFLDDVFRLSEQGKLFAYQTLFAGLPSILQVRGKERCRKLTYSFALLFRFFNCNDFAQLNAFFSQRKYDSDDPFQNIVEVDREKAYGKLSWAENIAPDIKSIQEHVARVEAGRSRERLAITSGTGLPQLSCGICLETMGLYRPTIAIPCARLHLAVNKSSFRYGQQADKQDWNGAHIFHKSCLQQWIRCSALDPSKSEVTCPRCRVQFYDKRALNAVRYKLFTLDADEEPSDDVYEVKSFLNRSDTFLVKSEDEYECVKKSVKKQMQFDYLVTKFRIKHQGPEAAAGDNLFNPYDIQIHVQEYLNSDAQETYMDNGDDAKIAKLLTVMKRDKLLVIENEDMVKNMEHPIATSNNFQTCRGLKIVDADDSDSDFDGDNDAFGVMTSSASNNLFV